MKVTCESAGGAAGTEYWNLVFTNNTSHAISVEGHPLVTFITDAGQWWNRAILNTVNPPVPVTLREGRSAYALLGVSNPGNYGESPPVKNISWLLIGIAGHDPKLVKTPAPIPTVGSTLARLSISAVSATKL